MSAPILYFVYILILKNTYQKMQKWELFSIFSSRNYKIRFSSLLLFFNKSNSRFFASIFNGYYSYAIIFVKLVSELLALLRIVFNRHTLAYREEIYMQYIICNKSKYIQNNNKEILQIHEIDNKFIFKTKNNEIYK